MSMKEAFKYIDICFKAQLNGAYLYPFLRGPAGIGKTTILKKYAKEHDYAYKEVILGRYGCLDIQGLWAPDYTSKKLEHFPTGRLLDAVEGKDATVIGLDEVTNAQPDVHAAVQSLLTSREIEGYRLPDNVLIALAGNGVNDGCNSRELPASMLDRVVTINCDVNRDEWLEVAEENDINPYIIAYHKWNDSALFTFDPQGDYSEKCFSTPRGWFKFNDLINQGVGSNDLKNMGAGILGEVEVNQFMVFKSLADTMPTYSEIINDPEECKRPSNINSCYAVIANIGSVLKRKEKGDILIEEKECEQLVKYISTFSEEWQVYALRFFEKISQQFLHSIACSKMEIFHNKIWNQK